MIIVSDIGGVGIAVSCQPAEGRTATMGVVGLRSAFNGWSIKIK